MGYIPVNNLINKTKSTHNVMKTNFNNEVTKQKDTFQQLPRLNIGNNYTTDNKTSK